MNLRGDRERLSKTDYDPLGHCILPPFAVSSEEVVLQLFPYKLLLAYNGSFFTLMMAVFILNLNSSLTIRHHLGHEPGSTVPA